MLQSFKKVSWIILLAFVLQTSWAFSLLGPVANGGDAWQVEAIAYNPIPANSGAPPFFIDALATGPKNLGEEYRRNTPVMYYACDANYLDYFGSSGSAAIDQAFNILNNSLTNVDSYSTALTEYPLNSEVVNYQARSLDLVDLKSQTMSMMMEQLGLADSVRYVWCLHNRFQPAGTTCPDQTTYQVIMRNYDIATSPLNQVQYSPYINGSLYSYNIIEICSSPAAPPNADAYEFLVDPLTLNPPVASLNEAGLASYYPGVFYTGLTRDDEAGLRYLLSTNNVVYESPTPGSVLVSSTTTGGINYGPPFVLYTSNYTAFAEAALTNDPVTLSNLYPGLIITSSTPYFSYQPTTTYVAYYTNLIGAPAGSQTLVVVPVTTYSVVTTYSNTYANVIITSTNGSSVGLLYTVTVGPLSGAPAGSPFVTNTTTSFVSQPNVPTGDFYINTNACGTNLILSTLASIPVYTTNVIYSATNALGQSALQYVVTTSTIHIYVAEAPICGTSSGGGTTTNAPGLYQGIGHMQFVKTSYDSLLGQFYLPITNNYTVTLVINHQSIRQTFQRVVTTPDFLFSAADLLPGPAADNNDNIPWTRNITFDQSTIGAGLAGPGVINPSSTITYTKVGPVFQNVGTASLSLSSASRYFLWGSFDGSTNDPVVYPNGASIANLANQVLIQLTPAILPAGTNGVAYATTSFVATGGPVMPPYNWSVVSGDFPPGLNLSSAGTISGTPTQSGVFDFTVMLTDSLSRTVTWNYSITIN
jgi:hypothetical protein